MPSRHTLTIRQIVGISPHAELIIMASLGMVRNVMGWFSFTWNGNIQKIWNLPGPEPSFTLKYHFDYWLKNILSMVALFRNLTTHLHLLFYIVMLYPLLTGERPCLMLPWLYLQMMKNIVMDMICTAAGVLFCWMFHSCGLLTLEFLVVQILSMMPSIYLWRRLRSYYFDLYYTELDGEYFFPPIKETQDLTLAQRRRATKSLDGTIPIIASPDNRSRINSCLTYDEFFGPANWEEELENKVSKSLTTLLTIESQESDDVEEDPCLKIIDDANLTPAEKTMKILGLIREEVDTTSLLQQHKRTSTADLEESRTGSEEPLIDLDCRSLFFSVIGEIIAPRTVAIQVRLPNGSKPTALNTVFDFLEKEGIDRSKKCECCEETKCSKEDDTSDSDEEGGQSTSQSTNVDEQSSRVKSLDCCDQNRKENNKRHEMQTGNKEMDNDDVDDADAQKNHSKFDTDLETVSTTSRYCKNDLYPSSCLQAVVERDGIAWENLKEINFVSVINKALSNEIKPFKLQRYCVDGINPDMIATPVLENLIKDWETSTGLNSEKSKCQNDRNSKDIIPEREDGTKFIHRPEERSDLNNAAFSGPTSASFGVDSDILALNASQVFGKMSMSEAQSFDSTAATAKQLIRPDHDTGFESYFKSSFQRHSNMFADTRAPLELLDLLPCRAHTSNYRVAHGVNEDSCSFRSRSSIPQYRRDNHDTWDFSRGIITGNDIDIDLDISESRKSSDRDAHFDSQACYDSEAVLKDHQTISGLQIYSSQLKMAEKSVLFSPMNLTKENVKPTRASQTSSMISKAIFEAETPKELKSNYIRIADQSNSVSKAIAEFKAEYSNIAPFSVTGDKLSSKVSRRKGSKDRRSVDSLSRSSKSGKIRNTPEERETKAMQALKAYNEQTLFKYKREMDARNYHTRDQDSQVFTRHEDYEFPNDLESRQHPSFVNHAPHDPSVPQLEIPEIELILKIENAYARFTRSKPADPASSMTLHENCGTKQFFDVYSGGGRMKKETQKIKDNDKTAMRKQHSKYSKLGGGRIESDVTSRSCKQIEGLQEGRDLDRIVAKENIISQNMAVYFIEGLANDTPSTSKSATITTIKSFSRKDSANVFSTVSSEILTRDGSGSSMIEVLKNPEEIPCRIEDSEHYRRLRKKSVPENVKEAVNNIDWSFQAPAWIGSNRPNSRQVTNKTSNTSTRIVRTDVSLEHQDIVQKTTETMLQSAFAHSDNSERGFCLSKSVDEFYPIFNTVTIAIEEIVRASALRGYTNEFISQPATEIGVPEIRIPSSRGFLRRGILPEDTRALKKRRKNGESLSITASTVPDAQLKKQAAVRREQDLLDQDETTPVDDEELSSLLSKLIASPEPRTAEMIVPIIGTGDFPEEPEDTSGDLPIPRIRNMEDFSSFLFDGSTSKKSPTPSKCGPENSFQVWPRTNRISSERLRLAMQNVIYRSPGPSLDISRFPDMDNSQFGFEVAFYRGILDRYNAGKELQSIIIKVLDEFPNCETCVSNEDPKHVFLENLSSSDFMTGLQIVTNLHAIETNGGGIIKMTEYRETSEETPSSSLENLSLEENDQSERRSEPEQVGTSSTMNFEHVIVNTSLGSHDSDGKEDREKKENNIGYRVVVEMNSKPDSRASSLDKVDKLHDDKMKLLSNISVTDSVSPPQSELLNRTNFRRRVINSAFVQAIKQGNSSGISIKGSPAEILASNKEDLKVQNECLAANYQEFNEFGSHHLIDDSVLGADMPELWITDDEQVPSRSALACPMEKVFLVDDNNARPEILLRDIENAESAIKRMKTLLEHFIADDQKGREQTGKPEPSSVDMNSKVSSLTNLRFLVNGEFRKLQNWVQTVANYATITQGCSSAQSIKSFDETVGLDARRKELYAEDVPETLSKKEVNFNTDDCQVPELLSSKRESSQRNSQGPGYSKNEVDRFSSWDKMIPLTMITKGKQKSKRKKAEATGIPFRSVIKVVRLIEEQNSDFSSARSVPQRGRGLSSGYLMDSDSDGNFTVSRPLTPVSVESVTSLTLSHDNERSDVFSNPLKVSDLFPMSDTSRSRTTTRPVETCWSSSIGNPINNTSVSTGTSNFTNNSLTTQTEMKNIAKKSDGNVEVLECQSSSQILSRSLLLIDGKVSSIRESALPDTNGGDKSTQNALLDEESHVLSAERLRTDSDPQNMTSINAAGIENKLEDVIHQISSYKFSRVNVLINGFPSASRDIGLISNSSSTKSGSSIDLQFNNCNREQNIEEQCRNRIEEILSKADDTIVEELNVHCRGSDSMSGNSEAISFDVSPRKSRVSLKNVAIGTEYNIKVFKELLDIYLKMRSKENQIMPEQATNPNPANPWFGFLNEIHSRSTSNSSLLNSPLDFSLGKNSSATDELPILESVEKEKHVDTEHFSTREEIDTSLHGSNFENGSFFNQRKSVDDMPRNFGNLMLSSKKLEVPEQCKSSYDSFGSLFFQNTTDVSESSCNAISISNHTYLEEFPELIDTSFQSSTKFRDVANSLSTKSIKLESKEDGQEKDLEKDTGVANSDERSNNLATVTPGTSKTNGESKKSLIPKKRGISRPVKSSKERK